MTIIHPKAFNDALPHSYDGLYAWEYVDDGTRHIRNIHSADIDDAIDIGGNGFLHIDTSDNVDKFFDPRNGQNRRTMAYTRTGLVWHIDIVGKIVPTQWRWHRFNERGVIVGDWQYSADGRNEIRDQIHEWADDRDAADPYEWRKRLIRAALFGASTTFLKIVRKYIDDRLKAF